MVFIVLNVFYFIGIVVEASSGALRAGRKQMDLLGVLVVANITAFGGGTLRDLLIDGHPLTWVEHPVYILFTSISAILTIFIAKFLTRFFRILLILDALGLASFTILGYMKAIHLGMPLGVAIIIGLVTGIGGGLLRDLLCHEEPLVFKNEFYGTAALAGTISMALLGYFQLNLEISIILSFLVVFAVRMVGIIWKVGLPKFIYY